MIKWLLGGLIICVTALGGVAQSKSFKGSKSLMAIAGVSGHGNYLGAEFDFKMSNRVFLCSQLGFENSQQEALLMKSSFVDLLAKWDAIQFGKLHVLLAMGPSLAFERTVNTDFLDETATKIGISYGVHSEYILGRYFVTAGAMQKSYSNQKFGKHRYMAGVGVGITF